MKFLAACWRSNSKFRFGTIVMATIIIVALIGPLLYSPILKGESPARPGTFGRWLPFSAKHPLGTEGSGRDLFAAYLSGLSNSLKIGFIAGVVATFLGIIVGFVTGFKGGWIESILTLLANMWMVIPSYPVLVAMAMVMPGMNLVTMSLILALFSWPYAARTIHAQIVGMKQLSYVEMAKVSGQGDLAIIFTEIMPNLVPYLFMGFAFAVVGAMVAEVGLEVIGLGPSNMVTLGLLINFANGWSVITRGHWEMLVIPVGLLILIFMAITMINRGMEEQLNPRLQTKTEK